MTEFYCCKIASLNESLDVAVTEHYLQDGTDCVRDQAGRLLRPQDCVRSTGLSLWRSERLVVVELERVAWEERRALVRKRSST